MRLLLLGVLLAGCGYTSQYTPPLDGRPRAVWREDRVVVSTSGAWVPPACAVAAGEMTGQ